MKTRDWQEYLSTKLVFPFMAERIDDTDKVIFEKLDRGNLFSLGHTMKVLSIEMEDDLYGIIVKVREGRQTGFVPILDVEIQEDSMNKKYLDEYADWFGNE